MRAVSFEIVILLATTLGIAVALGFSLAWALRLRTELKALSSPPRLPKGTRLASGVLLGIEKVGKTSLAHAIADSGSGVKALATLSAGELVTSWRIGGDESLRLYLADYPGSNFAELFEKLVREQSQPYSAFRFGQISTIVLLVDLVPPREQTARRNPRQRPDKERVSRQLKVWQESLLQAVLGFSGRHVRFVIFINKLDLVDLEGAAAPYFSVLEERVKKVGVREVQIIEGSAATGQGIRELRSTIAEAADVHSYQD